VGGRSDEWLIQIAALCGYPDTALKRSRELLSAARLSSDNPAPIAIAIEADAGLNSFLGNGRKMLERTEELLALATDHHMPFWTLVGNVWRGSALAVQGQVEEGIAEMRRARQAVAESPLLLLLVLLLLTRAICGVDVPRRDSTWLPRR
jgi:hypothetical protein